MALGILGAFYLRARFAISPDALYNHAMAKLNADPAVCESHFVAWRGASGSHLHALCVYSATSRRCEQSSEGFCSPCTNKTSSELFVGDGGLRDACPTAT